MSDYHSWFVSGGTYFFTLVTYRRQPLFGESRARQIVGRTMRRIRREMPFTVIAILLLPDHLHILLTLPPGDNDYSTRWQRIKRDFTV